LDKDDVKKELNIKRITMKRNYKNYKHEIPKPFGLGDLKV